MHLIRFHATALRFSAFILITLDFMMMIIVMMLMMMMTATMMSFSLFCMVFGVCNRMRSFFLLSSHRELLYHHRIQQLYKFHLNDRRFFIFVLRQQQQRQQLFCLVWFSLRFWLALAQNWHAHTHIDRVEQKTSIERSPFISIAICKNRHMLAKNFHSKSASHQLYTTNIYVWFRFMTWNSFRFASIK